MCAHMIRIDQRGRAGLTAPYRMRAGCRARGSLLGAKAGGGWSVLVVLDAKALQRADPVALMSGLVAATPALRAHAALLGTVVSELYGNALEHGVLGLDSRCKDTSEGFERYLEQREQALKNLRCGWLRLAAQCRYGARGGVITIRFDDSGAGFDRTSVPPATSGSLHGRGLALLRGLGVRIGIARGGRGTRATYRWMSNAEG